MNGMLSRYRPLLMGMAFFFFLAACTKQIKPTPSTPKQDATLEELLSLYKQRLSRNTPMKALMQVDADLGARGRHSIQSAVHASKAAVQVRGFNLFGGTLFDLKVDALSFSLKTASEPMPFEAELDFYEDLAGRQIPFGSLDLLRWVQRGGVPDTDFPKIPMLEKGEVFFTLYLFTVTQGRAVLEEKMFIERSAFRVTRVELFDVTGFRRGIIELNDYRMINGNPFPFSVKGTGRGEAIHLTFKEVSFPDLNGEIK